ncbi:transposase [Desulfurispirillum indicum]|uniref:IS91 family transposase n=1 Tax=Desulfurispirillum indicum TaxID=936456 RepID=UPI001CF9A916|nr:transposase [Desulfurispirillum indicum]UCZ57634.1 transposase [Desulfurispirillum indicum]
MLLSTIIKEFRKSFLRTYQKNLLPSHIKALESMARCRQAHGPHMVAHCSDHQCAKHVYIPHSCGHRNCPHCQNHESQQWLENQLEKRLPCQYFLITFTLPGQLRDMAWKNQRAVYTLMFTAVQDLLKSFTGNDKKLGGSPGFTAILHTHSRTLDYHPHIHVIMPGASINLKTRMWKEKSGKYLFSHKALARVFRAKLLQSFVENTLPVPYDCPKQWVVDCKDAGNGEKALIYLGRYLYRGVIREQDILYCKDGMVTFQYRHAKSAENRTRTVTGEYFLYLLMLHVLPRGFRRARSYGFLHACSKKLIRLLQVVLRVKPWRLLMRDRKPRPSIVCPVCGATMGIIATRVSRPRVLPAILYQPAQPEALSM